MQIGYGRAVFLVAAAMLLFTHSAYAQTMVGSVDQGRVLATKVCIACHLVEKGDSNASTYVATSFQDIANNPGHTELSLRVFLTTPHKDMPNLVLTVDETDSLIAYILSLR